MWVQQRFAQHVQINIVGKRANFVRYKTKFIHSHKPFFTFADETKTATKIATVADFDVNFFEVHSDPNFLIIAVKQIFRYIHTKLEIYS